MTENEILLSDKVKPEQPQDDVRLLRATAEACVVVVVVLVADVVTVVVVLVVDVVTVALAVVDILVEAKIKNI